MRLLSLLLVVTIVVVSSEPMGVCDFGNGGIGLYGSISISQTSSGITLDFSGVTDTDGVLTEEGNSIHIHKLGFNDWAGETCDSASTSGHFNPLVNYGELSCINGYFNASEIDSLVWEQPAWLTGANGIFGRSLVFHDSSTARVACCNIEIVGEDVTGAAAPDYDLEAVCGPIAVFQNDTHFWIENMDTEAVYWAPVDSRADCTVAGGVEVIQPDEAFYWDIDSLSIMGDNQVAGSALAVSSDNTTFACCTVVIKTAVANCPGETACDVCVSTPDSSDMMSSGMMSDSMGSMDHSDSMDTHDHDHSTDLTVSIFVSMALLVASIFF